MANLSQSLSNETYPPAEKKVAENAVFKNVSKEKLRVKTQLARGELSYKVSTDVASPYSPSSAESAQSPAALQQMITSLSKNKPELDRLQKMYTGKISEDFQDVNYALFTMIKESGDWEYPELHGGEIQEQEEIPAVEPVEAPEPIPEVKPVEVVAPIPEVQPVKPEAQKTMEEIKKEALEFMKKSLESIENTQFKKNPLAAVESVSDFTQEDEVNEKLLFPLLKTYLDDNIFSEEELVEMISSEEKDRDITTQSTFILQTASGEEIFKISKNPLSIIMATSQITDTIFDKIDVKQTFDQEFTKDQEKTIRDTVTDLSIFPFHGEVKTIKKSGSAFILAYENYDVKISEKNGGIIFSILETSNAGEEAKEKDTIDIKNYDKTAKEVKEKETPAIIQNKKAQEILRDTVNYDWTEKNKYGDLIKHEGIDGNIGTSSTQALKNFLEFYADDEIVIDTKGKKKANTPTSTLDKRWETKILITETDTIEDLFLTPNGKDISDKGLEILEQVSAFERNKKGQKLLSEIEIDSAKVYSKLIDGKVGTESTKALNKIVKEYVNKEFEITLNGKTQTVKILGEFNFFSPTTSTNKKDQTVLSIRDEFSEQGILLLQAIKKQQDEAS